ncbi:hypothetical protein EVA_22667 [gut metagenome]|uniref:Uncharacterized protein n=1 Tax=gut metagenome TaxID=749906 RepID=J9F3W9_9ZZZZ
MCVVKGVHALEMARCISFHVSQMHLDNQSEGGET